MQRWFRVRNRKLCSQGKNCVKRGGEAAIDRKAVNVMICEANHHFFRQSRKKAASPPADVT